MAKNISENTIPNALINDVKLLKKRDKEQRTNQNYPLGYFPLPQGLSTTVEVLAGVPDGSIYYSTNLHVNRKKENGVWSNM